MRGAHRKQARAIIAACLWLQAKGYVVGTYGNISVRVAEGLLITPSRIEYTELKPDDLVVLSLDGEVVAGTRLPSSELEVHRQVYLARADAQAVIHTHSLYSAAASTLHETIPAIVEEQSQVLGSEIRCSEYVPAGQHQRLGQEAARTLGSDVAALLANHGVVACGRRLDETLFATQIVERVAQMYLLARAAGGATPIPAEHVVSERERYLFKYGTAADKPVAAAPVPRARVKHDV